MTRSSDPDAATSEQAAPPAGCGKATEPSTEGQHREASGPPPGDLAPASPELVIGERERSMLTPLLREVVQTLGSSPSGQEYQALLEAVDAGAVGPAQFRALENFLELGLHTGRFRARFGALGEEALVRLFHQTPRGALVVAALGEVNRALAALAGQTIGTLELAASGPDRYGLTIETDRCRLTVRLEPTGVRVSDLELAM